MKNSYNDDSSDVLPTHMFEWAAATKDIDGSSVARDVVKYDLRDKRAALHESKTSSNRKLEKRLDQLGETIMSRLESEDFDCGFSINENAGSIKVTYDDADGTATYYSDLNVSSAGNLTITPSGGNLSIPAATALTFGAVATDGSWQIVRSGNNLLIQRYDTNTWVTKSTISA